MISSGRHRSMSSGDIEGPAFGLDLTVFVQEHADDHVAVDVEGPSGVDKDDFCFSPSGLHDCEPCTTSNTSHAHSSTLVCLCTCDCGFEVYILIQIWIAAITIGPVPYHFVAMVFDVFPACYVLAILKKTSRVTS